MISAKTFLASSIAIIASFITAEAAVAPTYPFPGTVQTSGQTYDITWTFDGKNASTKYQIDFMTGSNDKQTVLYNVAKGVDPSLLKYSYVAPEVNPNSAVYFFMFTGDNGEYSWTTRFGIVGAEGQKLTDEPEKKQPNGDAIPWGNGKLASNATSAVAAANATSAASIAAAVVTSSAAPVVSSAAASSSVPVASSAASSAANAVTSAASSAVSAASSVAVAAASTNASTKANSGVSMVKPAFTLASAAVAAYFAL
ncbi:hypothetical protein BD560DRAFT_386079 [Blakeslea trispora]|nr:hypothetical protein BD560DRAFT_386079 [Blakeslea trispora]